MKDGDRVQVQPIQVKSTEWLLRDKVKGLQDEVIKLGCDLDVKTRLLACYREDYSACFARCKKLLEVTKFARHRSGCTMLTPDGYKCDCGYVEAAIEGV
jgi:hypothetical protein